MPLPSHGRRDSHSGRYVHHISKASQWRLKARTQDDVEVSSVAASSSSSEESSFVFDLPAELLLSVIRSLQGNLETTLAREDAHRLLVPLTVVCRKWHELCRPLTLTHVRIHPHQADKLLTALCTPRRWGALVRSLKIEFGLHFAGSYTPHLLGVIAACSNLQSLSLSGCGKPVHKTFVLQADAVLYSSALHDVLAKLEHLDVSGTRKTASTGLDAAKILAWILPLCPNLVSLQRGWLSFQETEVAALQPIPFAIKSEDNQGQQYTFNRHQQRFPVSVEMRNLTSLTLSSRHLGARAFAQSLDLCVPGVLQELVVHCHDAPNRRCMEDVFQRFGNSLRILKLSIPFSNHRLYQAIDSELPKHCPNLESLLLVGPMCTDALLLELPIKCPKLKHVSLIQNKAVKPHAVAEFLLHPNWVADVTRQNVAAADVDAVMHSHSNSPISDTITPGERLFLIDDMLHNGWSAQWIAALENYKMFTSPYIKDTCSVSSRETGNWRFSSSEYSWFEFTPPEEPLPEQHAQIFSADFEGGDQCTADNLMLRDAWYDADYVPDIQAPVIPGLDTDMAIDEEANLALLENRDAQEEQEISEDEASTDASDYEDDWEAEFAVAFDHRPDVQSLSQRLQSDASTPRRDLDWYSRWQAAQRYRRRRSQV